MKRRPGFTLVELLVVIAVIGMLMNLLLPAVNGVRENARQLSCKNNLYQYGRAIQSHVQATGGRYPTGGWGWNWPGDPDLGNGKTQPGGWLFNVLPFLDMEALYSVGAGKEDKEKLADIAKYRLQTPVQVFNCPSRRRATNYPLLPDQQNRFKTKDGPLLEAARCDYAINSGGGEGCTTDKGRCQRDGGPNSLSTGLDDAFQRTDTSGHNGISFRLSEVRESELDADGTHNVYLVGEKFMGTEQYENGYDCGDNEIAMTGWNNDNYRSGCNLPWHDRVLDPPAAGTCFSGGNTACSFGSAHPAFFHMVFCDGHVQGIRYSINIGVHRQLCNRRDGETVNLDSL